MQKLKIVDEEKYTERFGYPMTSSHSMDMLIGFIIVLTILLMAAGVIRCLT